LRRGAGYPIAAAFWSSPIATAWRWIAKATLAPAITQIRFGGDDMRDVYITAVPADAGERLAEGKLPEGEVSFLYRGRSSVPGFTPPKITLGAIQ
jgi:hypothetical protein